MTELQSKLKEAKTKADNPTEKVGFITTVLVNEMRRWILFLWILSTFTFFSLRIIRPDFLDKADGLAWGFATLMINSLMLLAAYIFKK